MRSWGPWVLHYKIRPLPPCYNLQYSDPYIGMSLIEWFRSEFLVPKRLGEQNAARRSLIITKRLPPVFNLVWYGLQLFLFSYGWYSQVSLLAAIAR